MPRERIIVHITITLFNKYLISMTTCVTVLVLLFFTIAHLCGLVSQTVCYWRIKWHAQVSSTDYDATVVLIGRLHNILRHDHVLKLLMSTYYKAMRLSMRSW